METAIEPSPTADATRLTLPDLISPTAKTPGKLVSSMKGVRARGQFQLRSSCFVMSGPVFTNDLLSRATQFSNHSEFGAAPIIEKTAEMILVSVSPDLLFRHSTVSS